jgi:DnaJ-class molecular chaperone
MVVIMNSIKEPNLQNNIDLYSILEVSPSCDQDIIKKAYNKQVLKWHPDKNIDKNINILEKKEIEKKFQNIQTAYEILKDPNKRKEYDNMNSCEKMELFDTVKTFIIQKYPKIFQYYKTFIETFYDNDENNLKIDIETLDFTNIYNNIIDKIPYACSYHFNKIKSESNCEYELDSYSHDSNYSNYSNDLDPLNKDIIIDITTTIEEKYLNKYAKISIERKTKDMIILFVSLLENKCIYEKEGEIINGLSGSIIVNILCKPSKILNLIEQNIYIQKEITLYEYLYGGVMDVNFINEVMSIEFNSFLNKTPVVILNQKGIPTKIDSDKNVVERGDLIIHFSIKDLHNIDFKQKIKNLN